MTLEQYERFKTVINIKGYRLSNVKGTIQNEHFYFHKGFAYKGELPGYQILFLVWDYKDAADMPDDYRMAVTPLILTESKEWPRIDLSITITNFDVDKIEEYARDFYYHFNMLRGL